MAFMIGAFLDEYKKEGEKREVREATLSEIERKRLAEIAKEQRQSDTRMREYIEKQDIEMGLIPRRIGAEEKAREPYTIAREERQSAKTIEAEKRAWWRTRTLKAMEEVRDKKKNMYDLFVQISKNENGLNDVHRDVMKNILGYSPTQIKILEDAGTGVNLTKSFDEVKKDFTALQEGIAKNGIFYLPGGKEALVSKYGKHWSRLIGKGGPSIDAYWKEIGPRLSKMDAIKTSKAAREFMEGKKHVFNKAFTIPVFTVDVKKATDRTAEFHQHTLHSRAVINKINTQLTRKIIDINTPEVRTEIESILNNMKDTRNSIIGLQIKDNPNKVISTYATYQELEEYEGSELQKKLDEIQQQSGEKPSAVSNPNAKVSKPPAPPKPITTPTPILDDTTILLDPKRSGIGRTSILVSGDVDKSKKGEEQVMNMFRKGHGEQYLHGYLLADHERINNLLKTKASEVGMNLESFMDIEENALKYQKSYLTGQVASTFQKYSSDPSNVTNRAALAKDGDFHRKLIQLEKLDENFDAASALSEALFFSMATHKYDPSAPRADQITRIKGNESYLHHKLNKDTGQRELTEKSRGLFNRRRKNAADMRIAIKAVQRNLKRVDIAAGPVAGVAIKADYVAMIVKDGKDLLTSFTSGVKTDDYGSFNKANMTDANKGVVNRFVDRANQEAETLHREFTQAKARAEREGGLFDQRDFLVRSNLISQKIRLAYSLSAALQGDGAGGGRTISDTDFQYALAAVWGLNDNEISNRLDSILENIDQKQRRLNLYERYDKYGVASRLEDLMVNFDAIKQSEIENQRFNLLEQQKENTTKRFKLSDSDDNENYIKKVDLLTNAKIKSMQFGRIFSTAPKDRESQIQSFAMITRDYLRFQPAVTTMASAYSKALEDNKGLSPEAFVNTYRSNKDNKDSLAPVMITVANSLFPVSHSTTGVPTFSDDSVLKEVGKNVQIVTSSDPNYRKYKSWSVFKNTLEEYEGDTGGLEAIQNINRTLLAMAIETIHNHNLTNPTKVTP